MSRRYVPHGKTGLRRDRRMLERWRDQLDHEGEQFGRTLATPVQPRHRRGMARPKAGSTLFHAIAVGALAMVI